MAARNSKRQWVRRPDGLTRYVPVRFTQETITKVETLAKSDNTTVSNWIRRLVDERLSEIASAVDGDRSPSRGTGVHPEGTEP